MLQSRSNGEPAIELRPQSLDVLEKLLGLRLVADLDEDGAGLSQGVDALLNVPLVQGLRGNR
eukprot:2947637-Alexandrium_andersonii.AAC.1